MKADVLLKYHKILSSRGSEEASLYFALQFEGGEWSEDGTLPENADYCQRYQYEEMQKKRHREGMLLAYQYFSQALASKDPITKIRALSGRWRTMSWLAKEFYDKWGHYKKIDEYRRITQEINTSVEWRIMLRAEEFPERSWWPCRLFEKNDEGSILESEHWHFEKILSNATPRYRDCLSRFKDRGSVLWALGVIAELGLDGDPALERAMELYKKALSIGCSWASWRLGDMLVSRGKIEEARNVYENGVALGHPLAKIKLALLGGSDRLSVESVESLVDAARAGVGDAWYILMTFLSVQNVEGGFSVGEIETMRNVSINLCVAKAIKDGIKDLKPNQDNCQYEGDRMWAIMARSENAQDCYEAALHFLHIESYRVHKSIYSIYSLISRAARLGSAEAQCHLGRLHDPSVLMDRCSYGRDNKDIKKDSLIAFMWYEKSASNGSDEAKYMLAKFYKEGKLVPRDPEKCYELTLPAARLKKIEAMLDIAYYAKTGYGCKIDVEYAIDCYKEILLLSVAPEKDDKVLRTAQIASFELARIFDECFDGGARVAEALEYYRLAANIYNEPESHKKLSEWYEMGIGVDQDVDKAAEHLVRYLEIKGDNIGYRILKRVNRHKGRGCEGEEIEDISETAARCIEIAYAYETGISASRGNGWEQLIVPDAAKAFKWYSRGYENGGRTAGLRCAEMLIAGNGCDQNVNRAHDIYVDLAEDDFIEANLALAKMYGTGVLIESEGDKCSLHWLMRASELGSQYSRYLIGLEYEKAKSGCRDIKKAVKWYKLSQSQAAYLRLARCYRDGDGVDQDYKVAARYFRMCTSTTARIEFSQMCFEIGECLWQKFHSREKAFYWFLRAARLRNPKAQLRVAELYLFGNIVTVSLFNAARWNYWAAECHDPEGQWRFGVMCELGLGVDQSLGIAETYYRAASDRGHVIAKLRLIELGRLPMCDIDELANSGVSEARFMRAMSAIQVIGDEIRCSLKIDKVVQDFQLAAKGGIQDAFYGLYLCKKIDSTVINNSLDELLIEAVNNGSCLAILEWAKKKIDVGNPNDAIPKLWKLYEEGFKNASCLLRKAYKMVEASIKDNDVQISIQRKIDINYYLNARLAALETVYDKGKMSILLQSFICPKNNLVIKDSVQKFDIKFNTFRKDPSPIVNYDSYYCDIDNYYEPRTFEDAYEIYGSRLWDA